MTFLMARRLLPTLAITFLLVLATVASPALAGTHRDDDADNDNRGQGRGRGQDADKPALGRFNPNAAAGAAQGKYVNFTAAPDGIANYTVGNLTVFSARALRGAVSELPEVDMQGTRSRVDGDAYDFTAHDMPHAEARFRAPGGFEIEIPDGFSILQLGKAVEVRQGDSFRGVFFGKDLSLDGNVLTGKGDVHFLLNSKKGKFDHAREELTAAKVDGRVGAEVIVRSVDGNLEQAVVSFGNVTVNTLPRANNLTFIVDGRHGDPRVLILDVDPALLGNATLDRLDFHFDGERFSPADNLTDILDPDNDGLQPEYYVVPGSLENGTLQLIVSVPHYSVHAITIQSISALSPVQAVSVLVGVLAGVTFVALATVALFRRPRT